jgi:hypothetical protein
MSTHSFLSTRCVMRCTVRTNGPLCLISVDNMQIITISDLCINGEYNFQSTPNVYATKRTVLSSGCLSAEQATLLST